MHKIDKCIVIKYVKNRVKVSWNIVLRGSVGICIIISLFFFSMEKRLADEGRQVKKSGG